MPVNYSDPDRPRWYPRKPPPRVPEWVMRRMSQAKPPVQPGTWPLDWASYALGILLVVGILLAIGAHATALSVVLQVAWWLVSAFTIWRAFLHVVHEQQLCDWLNERPDAGDVPPEELPNG